MAVLVVDYSDNSAFTYPFSIQNLMHLIFFVSLDELLVRWTRDSAAIPGAAAGA